MIKRSDDPAMLSIPKRKRPIEMREVMNVTFFFLFVGEDFKRKGCVEGLDLWLIQKVMNARFFFFFLGWGQLKISKEKAVFSTTWVESVECGFFSLQRNSLQERLSLLFLGGWKIGNPKDFSVVLKVSFDRVNFFTCKWFAWKVVCPRIYTKSDSASCTQDTVYRIVHKKIEETIPIIQNPILP